MNADRFRGGVASSADVLSERRQYSAVAHDDLIVRTQLTHGARRRMQPALMGTRADGETAMTTAEVRMAAEVDEVDDAFSPTGNADPQNPHLPRCDEARATPQKSATGGQDWPSTARASLRWRGRKERQRRTWDPVPHVDEHDLVSGL